mmetsp:Transcript_24145/g.66908  ORF Transcript_24145/g.66908 Transcript_24145/m.66908 type:complete len:263 (+) Transcript_24145:583-1371(+)
MFLVVDHASQGHDHWGFIGSQAGRLYQRQSVVTQGSDTNDSGILESFHFSRFQLVLKRSVTQLSSSTHAPRVDFSSVGDTGRMSHATRDGGHKDTFQGLHSGRCQSLHLVTVPEFSVPIPSKRKASSIFRHHTRMIGTTRDLLDLSALHRLDQCGNMTTISLRVSEFTILSKSPSVHFTRFGNHCRMGRSGGDGHDSNTGQSLHAFGNELVSIRFAVTGTSGRVGSPCQDFSRNGQGYSVKIPTDDLLNVLIVLHQGIHSFG